MESKMVLKDLVAMLGADRIHTDEYLLHNCEGVSNSWARMCGVYVNPMPICIADVCNTEEVVKVVKYCNDNKVNMIARTGASSGECLLTVKDPNTIIVDASKMDQLIKLDKENMIVTVQCGYPLEKLENLLLKEGFTTGHYPQSLPLAHLGGLVATRSIGQFSTYFGGIEDMVTGLEAVMPDGRIVRIRSVPRRSAGPDLRHLFIGSEGGIGFITEVTVKIFPDHIKDKWMGGYIVKDMKTGFEAVREIMVQGYKPSVVRLYDKSDIDHNFNSVKLKDTEAFMFFSTDGPATVSRATGEAINEIALSFGGKYVGTDAVEHWFIHRNDLCEKMLNEEYREKQRQLKIAYSTIEISANWTDIKSIYNDVMENVPKKIDYLTMLGGHVSHSYINGTNIYFVFVYKISSPEVYKEEHSRIIGAICDEVIKYPSGGVVHHHGMGKERVVYAEREHGSSYSLMKDLKKLFDPNNIMNKGVLVDPKDL